MKPILFNTEMVRAILDGRKTVTRRVVKSQLPENVVEIHNVDPIGYLMFKTSDRLLDGWNNRKAPYCKGDALWVRETFRTDAYVDGRVEYRATPTCEEKVEEYDAPARWIPSIHMPKEAARIFLQVTDIRVERLQEITEEQAIKEGCYHGPLFEGGEEDEITAKSQFISLWESTIKKQDLDTYGWDANPWVWVIEFERISKEDAE